MYLVTNLNNIYEVNVFWMYSLAFHMNIHEQYQMKEKKRNM